MLRPKALTLRYPLPRFIAIVATFCLLAPLVPLGAAEALTITMDQPAFTWEISGPPCGVPCEPDGLARTRYTLDFLDGDSDGSTTFLNFQTSLPQNDIYDGYFEGGWTLSFDVPVISGCANPGAVAYQDGTLTACGSNGSFFVETDTNDSSVAALNWTNEVAGLTQFAFSLQLDGVPTSMTLLDQNVCQGDATRPACEGSIRWTTGVSAVPEPTAAVLFGAGICAVSAAFRRRRVA